MATNIYLANTNYFTPGASDTYTLKNTPTTIDAADTLIINTGQTLIIKDTKKLQIKGSLENSGTVTVNTGCDCYAEDGGVIDNKEGANISVSGELYSIYAGSKIENSGTITVKSGGDCFAQDGGEINNNKTITVESDGHCNALEGGVINNNVGANINVTGFLYSYGEDSKIENSGTVTVFGGYCFAQSGGEINNNVGGTITVKCDGKLFKQTGGVINNSGTIINEPCPPTPTPIGAAAAKVHRSLFANNSLVFYKSHSSSSSTGSGGVGNSRFKRRKT